MSRLALLSLLLAARPADKAAEVEPAQERVKAPPPPPAGACR